MKAHFRWRRDVIAHDPFNVASKRKRRRCSTDNGRSIAKYDTIRARTPVKLTVSVNTLRSALTTRQETQLLLQRTDTCFFRHKHSDADLKSREDKQQSMPVGCHDLNIFSLPVGYTTPFRT